MGKLGDTLRERRIALNITLEEAEAATRLRCRQLEALEAGDWEHLPNPGYVRGYISSYARFLELDPLPLLAMYKAETGATGSTRLDLPQTEEAVAPFGQQHALPLTAGIIAVVVTGLVSLSIWAAWSFLREPEPTPPAPIAPTADAQATPGDGDDSADTIGAIVDEPGDSDDAVGDQDQGPELVPFTLGVRVASDGASWVRVTVDGKRAYEGTLTGGQSKTFEVAEEASVRVGKRESVTLTRDGEPVEVRGTGDVPTVTIKAEPAQ